MPGLTSARISGFASSARTVPATSSKRVSSNCCRTRYILGSGRCRSSSRRIGMKTPLFGCKIQRKRTQNMSYATSIQAVSTCHIVAVPQKFVNRIVDHVNAVNFGKNGRKEGDGPDRLLFEMINIKHWCAADSQTTSDGREVLPPACRGRGSAARAGSQGAGVRFRGHRRER